MTRQNSLRFAESSQLAKISGIFQNCMTIPRPEVNNFSLTKHIMLEYLDSESTNLDFQSLFFICIHWEV